MTRDSDAEATAPFDKVQEMLNRARQVDPTVSEAAIRGYMLEVEEAESMLRSMELSGAAPLDCFSALWPDVTER